MTDYLNTNPEQPAIACALEDAKAASALAELEPWQMQTSAGADTLTAIKYLLSTGGTVDLLTVDAKTNGELTQYLVECVRTSHLLVSYGAYIELLRDQARRKKIADAAYKLMNTMADTSSDIDAASNEFITDLEKTASVESRLVSAGEATTRFVDSVDNRRERRATFGIGKLDEALGGMFGGKLAVIGARPATGKSALALSASMATQRDGTVLFCSFEMPPTEIIGRAMANLSGVNAQRISYRDLEPEHFQQMAPHYQTAYGLNIQFTETANTPAKIRTEALKLNRNGGLALIVIDYLQLMSSGRRAENRRIEVGQISRDLKRLAMELDVPVLALSQLNRQSEATQSKMPTMAEMKESGDIEQDADVIVLMYLPPPDQHTQKFTEKGCARVRLILEKNRQGMSGQLIDTAFYGANMRFGPVSEVIE